MVGTTWTLCLFFVSSCYVEIHSNEIDEWVSFKPCGFASQHFTLNGGGSEDYKIRTEETISLEKVLIKRKSVTRVVGFRSRIFEGPECVKIISGTDEHHVIGTLKEVKKKLGIR